MATNINTTVATIVVVITFIPDTAASDSRSLAITITIDDLPNNTTSTTIRVDATQNEGQRMRTIHQNSEYVTLRMHRRVTCVRATTVDSRGDGVRRNP